MTQANFMQGQKLEAPLVGNRISNSPMQMIPSKLTRKQILQMQLANQQQLPQVDQTRKKPKTGNENQYFKAVQQQQLYQSNPQNVEPGHIVFQNENFTGQKPYSP